MDCEKTKSTNDEYKVVINENSKRIIRKYDENKQKKINIFFEEGETNVMEDVIKQLSKFFVEEKLKT